MQPEPTDTNTSQKNSSSSKKNRWSKSFPALENIEFRWLLASNAAFFLALNGQILTRSILAWNMTQQEMSLAYINIAFAIPMLIFSLIGGVLSDRFERRRLIVLGQAALIINESFVLLLLITNNLEFWHLLVAGVVGGIIIPIIMPARAAIVYNTAGPKRLGNAVALGSGVMNLSRVIGPALMGWAISMYTPVGAYAFATALFVCAFLCIFGVKPKPINSAAKHVASVEAPIEALQQTSNSHIEDYQAIPKRPTILSDIQEGFRYIKANRPAFICLIYGFIPMCIALPFQNLLILYTEDVWQVGEQGLGVLMAVAGLGGLIGSMWVAFRGENSKRVKLMVSNAVAFSLLLIVFSFSSNFYWALMALLIANTCISISQTLNNTTLQLLIHDHQRGRVSSFMMLAFGFTPLGVLPLAWSTQHIGVAWTISIASAILGLIIAVMYLSSSTLKNLDNSVRATLKQQP